MRKMIAILILISFFSISAYYLQYDKSFEIEIDEIHYDDYIEAPNAVSAIGSVNIIAQNGEKNIHANSLGYGMAIFNDGYRKAFNVVKAPLDVYLLIGQSNAAYTFHGNISESSSTKPGTAYIYGPNEPADASNYNEMWGPRPTMRSMNNADGLSSLAT